MIKWIPKVTNMGVFKDLNWERDVRDASRNVIEFKELNIIYGRNYSGKTTLSRIIRAYETHEVPINYSSARFELQLDDGLVKSDQLAAHTQEFRVFNIDFIRDNLSFLIDEEGDIAAFALMGKPNIDIQEQIHGLQQEIGTNEPPVGLLGEYTKESSALQTIRDQIKQKEKSLNDQLVAKANKDIKENREYGDVRYDVRKLRADINYVLDPEFEDIDPNSIKGLMAILSEEPKEPTKTMRVQDLGLENLQNDVKELVERKIELTEPIQDLVNDTFLEAWARRGLDLHRDKRSVCGFCGSALPDNLFADLDAHFNEESESLRQKLEGALVRIENVRNNQSIRVDIDSSSFYAFLKESVDALDADWKLFYEELDGFLDELTKQINSRIASISTPLVFKMTEVPSIHPHTLEQRYNEIVRKHNAFTDKLEDQQELARIKLRRHDVKNFIETIKYREQVNDIEYLRGVEESKELSTEDIQKELGLRYTKIDELKAQIVSEEAARNQINEYLNHHLGHNALSLEYIGGEEKSYKFQVVRRGKPAYNLSEGERTLVAFCYFIAKLKELPAEKQPIIWIDDPISSLDSNHVFYIFGLIESEIIKAKAYRQLFVSTHNLDFLKYLLRIDGSKQCLMLDPDEKETLIREMPAYMEKYATEFNYLFNQIVSVAITDCSDRDACLSFPNEARKFLELFLRFKYPDPSLKESQLYEKFFSARVQDYRTVNRLINEDSHHQGRFEKALRPVYRPEQKKVANAILCNICVNDQSQFDALMNSVGYEERNEKARATCLRRTVVDAPMCYFK